jgi:hypothetical protein
MDETQSYIIVWNDAGYPKSLAYHDLAEGNSNDVGTEHKFILTYRREQLRATDRIVTDVLEAELLFGSATAAEPIAIPVSLARDLSWFPEARYLEFEMA